MVSSTRQIPAQPAIAVPLTQDEALDPKWLEAALVSVSQGRKITSVRMVEYIQTNVTKIRFAVTFAGDEVIKSFCIKGHLDADPLTRQSGEACILEGDFYTRIAPRLDLRTPEAFAVITDHAAARSVLIQPDLVVAGAEFCSVLKPFSVDQMAANLEQYVRLHAGSLYLQDMPWIQPRTRQLAYSNYLSSEQIQALLDDPRGDNLSPWVRSGERLNAGMRALADKDADRSHFLIHGDAHAGNCYRMPDGPGLIDWQMIQRAGWAIDIAYHLCSGLTVEVAEIEERRLLNHYLDMARAAGLTMPNADEAWLQYREAVMYGYFMWGITRTVAPDVIITCTDRLGRAVMRHQSHALLGIV